MRDLLEIVNSMYIVKFDQDHNTLSFDKGIVSITSRRGIIEILRESKDKFSINYICSTSDSLIGHSKDYINYLDIDDLIDLAYHEEDNNLINSMLLIINLKIEPLSDYLEQEAKKDF